ncbi:MAG: hypothetical protein AB7N76_09545 [Planctomycetota bacterium]
MSALPADPTLQLAERVLAAIREQGASAALIGAWAMLAHNFARPTADLDLATAVGLPVLRALGEALGAVGFAVELREPDPQDPLGGVLDVRAGSCLVQVVNFRNSASAQESPGLRAAEEAIATAKLVLEGSPLPVVDLPHLIALKLLSWDRLSLGSKPAQDIRMLLAHNPGADLGVVGTTCERVGLGPEWRAFQALSGTGE